MMAQDEDFLMTGKNLIAVQEAVKKFEQEREAKRALRRMSLQPDPSEFSHQQKRLLTIRCSKPPYHNRLVRVMVWFSDNFPFAPPRLFMEPVGPNRVGFLHLNVYQDTGKVCHNLLIPLKFGNKHISLGTIF